MGVVWTFLSSPLAGKPDLFTILVRCMCMRPSGFVRGVVRRCRVNFQCGGVQLAWIIKGQRPIVLAVGAGGGCVDIFFFDLSLLFSFSFSMGDGPICGWSGGAMVLGKLSVPGRPTIWIIVGQGPIALAVGAGGGCLFFFTLLYPFFPLSPSLWETARYRLKYCLKGPLNPKQSNNQRPDID